MDIHFVEDSQQSRDDLIYYTPVDLDRDSAFVEVEEISPSFIWEKRDKVSSHGPENLSSVVNGTHQQRSLRKRTAIQKMPYSLERIKHRQLLEGYDISSFEQISNELFIPEVVEKDQNEYLDVITEISDDSMQYAQEEVENSIDFNRNLHSNETNRNEIITEVINSDSDESNQSNDYDKTSKKSDKILFRGKRIDISTGYRGIMPKSAWDKQLSKSHDSKNIRRRRGDQNLNVTDHKGIAKRRQHGNFSRQDSLLLDELIVPDTTEPKTYVSNYQQPYVREGATRNQEELNDISAYFQNKYDTAYLSDEISDSDIEMNDFEVTKYRKQLEKSPSIPKTSEIMYVGNDEEAREVRILDPMLKKTRRTEQKKLDTFASSKKWQSRLTTRYRKRNNKNTLGFVKKTSLGKIRRAKRVSQKNSHQKSIKIHEKAVHAAKKRKINQYLHNRKPGKIFSTVVEAKGNRIGAIPNMAKTYSFNDEFNIVNDAKHPSSFMDILKIVRNKSIMECVNAVNITLSGKTFTLSKLNSKDLNDTLTKLFEEVVVNGASDDDLFQMSKLLSTFFYQLNLPSVRDPVSQFHKKFRLKVNNNRNVSKPIHFYVIAFCQVLFLEISWYSNLTPSTKKELETKILNHIVSFFKLLDLCYGSLNKEEDNILYECFDILATIVDEFQKKEQLWRLLEEQTFSASVALILCQTFPTKIPRWNIFNISHVYSEMDRVIANIKYCQKVCNWEITEEILLKIHNILKKRRFADFDEEYQLSKNNDIIAVFNNIEHLKPTIFNKYLSLIRDNKINNLLLEKITPVGEISNGDGKSVLINRLNLLLLLAHKSDLNIERRFEPIFNKLGKSDDVANTDTKTLESNSYLLISSIILLIDNNNSKNMPIKCKYLVRVLDNLLIEKSLRERIYRFLVKKIKAKFSTYGKQIKKNLLKQLFLILSNTIEVGKPSENVLFLLKLFSENVGILSPQWVDSHIFRIIKSKVGESKCWIDYYCIFGQYLVQHNIFSWWSFAMFNGLQNNRSLNMYFNGRIIETCDDQMFANLKCDLFSLLVEELPNYKDENFQFLLKAFMKRQSGLYFEVLQDFFLNRPSFWRHFLKALCKNATSTVICELISKVDVLYRNNEIQKEVLLKIMNTLDDNSYVDLSNESIYIKLKYNVGVIDTETRNVKFRNSFHLLNSMKERVYCLERLCIQYDPSSDLDDRMLFLSKTSIAVGFSFYALVVETVKFNDLIHSDEFVTQKVKVIDVLMRILNKINASKFYSFNDEEFMNLLALTNVLSQYFTTMPLEEKPYQFHHFQMNMLHLTAGFSEYKKLYLYAKYYVTRVTTTRTITDIQNQDEKHLVLNEILRTTSYSKWFSSYQVEYTSPKDHNKLLNLVNEQISQDQYL